MCAARTVWRSHALHSHAHWQSGRHARRRFPAVSRSAQSSQPQKPCIKHALSVHLTVDVWSTCG